VPPLKRGESRPSMYEPVQHLPDGSHGGDGRRSWKSVPHSLSSQFFLAWHQSMRGCGQWIADSQVAIFDTDPTLTLIQAARQRFPPGRQKTPFRMTMSRSVLFRVFKLLHGFERARIIIWTLQRMANAMLRIFPSNECENNIEGIRVRFSNEWLIVPATGVRHPVCSAGTHGDQLPALGGSVGGHAPRFDCQR